MLVIASVAILLLTAFLVTPRQRFFFAGVLCAALALWLAGCQSVREVRKPSLDGSAPTPKIDPRLPAWRQQWKTASDQAKL